MKPRYGALQSFLLWKTADRPVDWVGRFGRSAPLVMEIGFGNGDYLLRNALAHPDHDYVGVELEWASTRRALRRIFQSGARNVRIIQTDARIVLERLFSQRSLSLIYALFPCPWPKEKHARFRLFSRSFLELANSRLTDGGRIRVVTDSLPYEEWIADQARGTGFTCRAETLGTLFDTKYERKWRELGREDFRELILEKTEHREIPPPEDMAVKTYRVSRFDPQRFRPADQTGAVAVIFKDYLYDPLREKALCRAVTAEDGLVQQVWVEILREEGDWHIRVSPGCTVVPTVGVQRAVDLVYEGVRQSSP